MRNFLIVIFCLLVCVSLPIVHMAITKNLSSDVITLNASNTIVLDAEVNGDSEGQLLAMALSTDKQLRPGDPIYLYLQTPGGSVTAGEEIIEVLHGLGRPVHTITAHAASMGFLIAQNLGTRYILSTGVMMSHRASGGVEGSFGGKEPSQMQSRYNQLLREMETFDLQVVKRSNGKQTLESYRQANDQELYARGQDAVDKGYADQVAKVKCGASLSGTTTFVQKANGLQVEFQMANCPLDSNPQNIRVIAPKVKNMIPPTEDQIRETKRIFLQEFNRARASTIPLEL
jgi:ATP-dependent Clp protease protease subunit